MEKLIFISLLFCIAQISNGQTGSKPKTGDNEIIVTNVTFRQLADAILDQGYIIDKYDSSLGYIYTKRRPIVKHNASVKIWAHIKNGKAYLTGEYRVGSGQYALDYSNHLELYPIIYYKSAMSTLRKCWNELMNLALSLGSNIEFAKL